MAKMDWNSFKERAAEAEAAAGRSRVGFFGLADDGDEAIVRIMHDSPDDFDLVAVHPTTIDGKFRNVSCLRQPNDPIDMCPYCADGKRYALRIYIHMLQYSRDDKGVITSKPVVWERGSSWAKTLVDYLNEYGPLSDVLFKIKRNGKKGSQDTTYTLMPASEKIYNPAQYARDDTAFEGYEATGNAVVVKTYEEMLKLSAAEGSKSTNWGNSAPAAVTPARSYAAPANTYAAPAAPVQPTYAAPAPTAVPQYEAPAAQPVAQPVTQPMYEAPAQAAPVRQPFAQVAQNAQPTAAEPAARPRRFY